MVINNNRMGSGRDFEKQYRWYFGKDGIVNSPKSGRDEARSNIKSHNAAGHSLATRDCVNYLKNARRRAWRIKIDEVCKRYVVVITHHHSTYPDTRHTRMR